MMLNCIFTYTLQILSILSNNSGIKHNFLRRLLSSKVILTKLLFQDIVFLLIQPHNAASATKGTLLWLLNGALTSVKQPFQQNYIASANLSSTLITHRRL